MKTIIAGSRGITDYAVLLQAIKCCPFPITSVVSGCARGIDTLGEQYAQENSLKLYKFPADWSTYGRRAGYLRNAQMADNAEALLAIWDGESRGTKHMIDIAREKGLEVYVYMVNNA